MLFYLCSTFVLRSDFLRAKAKSLPHVNPETFVSESIDEWAEEPRNEDKNQVVEKGQILRLFSIHNYCLCYGQNESQHAENKLKTMQHHSAHRFVH